VLDEEVYILINGKISVQKAGKEVTTISAPCIFGEVSFLYKKQRTATLKTLQVPCQILVITRGSLRRLKYKDTLTYIKVIHILTQSCVEKFVEEG
jgi:CRP-like cAMP-binding protein